MYTYRQLKPDRKAEVLDWRRRLRLPLHEPPHFPAGRQTYLLTAANYEHANILGAEARRDGFQNVLLDRLMGMAGAEVFAWVVLPNHYHVLARVDLAAVEPVIARLHNRTAQRWNKEDSVVGRKVWYRFSDRRVRNERHFYATVNYLHGNPVHHRNVTDAKTWPWSSLADWMDRYGRDRLLAMWRAYPVKNYGKGWDI